MNVAGAEGEKPKGDNPALDALDAEAQRVDNGGETPPPGPDAAQPGAGEAKGGEHSISTARLVQGALLGAGNLMGMRYPAVKRVYSEQRCGMVGEALAPVLDRWGINAQNSVAMQYVVAIGALALLGLDTVAAIKSSTHENTAPPPGAPAAKVVP
jgi:hypothetical protein